MQVTLVEEARPRGGLADAGAALEQTSRELDALGDLEAVRRYAEPGGEQADHAEAADAGRGGQLVERHVAGEVVAQELAGARQRGIGARGARERGIGARRRRIAARGRAVGPRRPLGQLTQER
jgi:hypothetical protein